MAVGSSRGVRIELHSLNGLERFEAEYRTLLARSGLRLARVVATQSPFAVIEAWPLV